MPRALRNFQPSVPHFCLQGHVSQPPNLLRLGRDRLVLAPKLQVPGLEDGLEGVHGAVVVVPLQRGDEEAENVRVEPRDCGLHLRSRVEDYVERVLREELGDFGDGFADFRGGFGVVNDCLWWGVSRLLGGKCGILTTNRSLNVPQAKETYSGWC